MEEFSIAEPELHTKDQMHNEEEHYPAPKIGMRTPK
jgi:hypothetical protein